MINDMLKNVHEACETLETTKSALEKATLAIAIESKVMLTTIRNKIQVTIFLLICYK